MKDTGHYWSRAKAFDGEELGVWSLKPPYIVLHVLTFRSQVSRPGPSSQLMPRLKPLENPGRTRNIAAGTSGKRVHGRNESQVKYATHITEEPFQDARS